MSQFKAMKFRVESPEHSEKIQKKLFEMGYGWAQGARNSVQHTNHPFLYGNENGQIKYDKTGDLDYFMAYPHQEMQLVETVSYDFVPVEKDVVMFDGKEYNKEQFKKLLKEVIESL